MNYAVIFGCAWLGFMASLVVIFFLKENPMSEEAITRSHEGSFFMHIGESFRTDPVYRRLLLTRLLTGVETMTAAFYVVFIKERLSLPDSSIGAFSVAYIVGGIMGVALFGAIADRFGPRRVINAATVLQFLAPTLALVVAITPLPDMSPLAAQGIFMLILAVNGAIARSMMLGFAGYAIDRAPDRRRAIYVGVFNTLGGVVALSPVLGGLFLDGLTASLGGGAYVLMFAAVALVVGLGATIGLTLPKPVRAE
jgi:MFS family permease